jgi:hypothetical protein
MCSCILYAASEHEILTSNMKHHYNLIHFSINPIIGGDLDIYYLSAKILNSIEFPKEIIFGMHNSGVFGFFSKYRVVNMDGLINGKTRLEYNRKYPYDFIYYMDESQTIGAYFDLIPENNLPVYNKIFFDRGFSVNRLSQEKFLKYGNFSLPTNQVNPMLYLAPNYKKIKID